MRPSQLMSSPLRLYLRLRGATLTPLDTVMVTTPFPPLADNTVKPVTGILTLRQRPPRRVGKVRAIFGSPHVVLAMSRPLPIDRSPHDTRTTLMVPRSSREGALHRATTR